MEFHLQPFCEKNPKFYFLLSCMEVGSKANSIDVPIKDETCLSFGRWCFLVTDLILHFGFDRDGRWTTTDTFSGPILW